MKVVQCFPLAAEFTVSAEPLWLQHLRQQSRQQLDTLELPDGCEDTWRFSDLSTLWSQQFCRKPLAMVSEANKVVSVTDLTPWRIPNAWRIVLVDGIYNSELSSIQNLESGISIEPQANQIGKDSLVAALVEQYLAKEALAAGQVFNHLNLAQFRNILLIRISAKLNQPVHLLHLASGSPQAQAIYPRLLLIMAAYSQAIFIEEYAALTGSEVYSSNSVGEIVLHPHARLEHIRIQQEAESAYHFGQLGVRLAEHSSYHNCNLAFGARISHVLALIQCTSSGAEVSLNGLTMIHGRQIAAVHTQVEHLTPNTSSRQLHKSIAAAAAHAIFAGKMKVMAGAHGTHSTQLSRNLLLASSAQIDTQPQLEIFNNDVICTHGASIGALDSEIIFFLHSRGLNITEATSLLTSAFAAEIINQICVPELYRRLHKDILAQIKRDKP